MFLSSPGLLLGDVHVNEEGVEPEMKHLLLQREREGGREEGREGGREGQGRE